jgi:hypothetical protein
MESSTHPPYPKTWEKPHALTSNRPISFLPIVSKVVEKLLLARLLPIVEHNVLIPSHQFGFRQRHSTTEQTQRIVHKINEAFEHKAYCSAAFLDISQAFDKVWHIGLLHKSHQLLPPSPILSAKQALPSIPSYHKSTPVFHKAVFSGRSSISLHRGPSNLPGNNHSNLC